MTAPDGLARMLAEHAIANAPDDGTGFRPVACLCGWVQDGHGHRAHLADVLASVVSRRDTDLRTRIEKLIAEFPANGAGTGDDFDRGWSAAGEAWRDELREAIDTHEYPEEATT